MYSCDAHVSVTYNVQARLTYNLELSNHTECAVSYFVTY